MPVVWICCAIPAMPEVQQSGHCFGLGRVVQALRPEIVPCWETLQPRLMTGGYRNVICLVYFSVF